MGPERHASLRPTLTSDPDMPQEEGPAPGEPSRLDLEALVFRLLRERAALQQRLRDHAEELNGIRLELGEERERRLAMERRLEQPRRLESFGVLAAGVVHDLNNLLTVMLGCSEMLRCQLADQPPLARLASDLGAAGESAGRLVERFLAIVEQDTSEPVPIDLWSLLDELASVLRALVGARVVLEFWTPTGPAYVRAAPALIEQVLINLCVNARDAMPAGGRLQVVGLEERGRAGVAVRDTGAGMTRQAWEQASRPIDEASRTGRTGGIGLPTVHGIVHQLGGQVEFESQLGLGTTVTFWLPSVEP